MNENKPLTTEDVHAATLPLHVGVDRVAMAREAAAKQSETFPDAQAHVAPQRAPLPAGLVQGPRGVQVEHASPLAPLEATDTTEADQAIVSDPPQQENDAPNWPALNIFPTEIAQHIAAIDERGLVQLNGLPNAMGPQIRNTWFAIAEVGEYLPNDQAREFVQANTANAADIWAECRELVDGQATGPLITGTLAVPARKTELLGKWFNGATVDGVLSYIKAPHGG